ncbi:MAG TPA: tetratricopeptide repeat protein [Candidatus Acidoferrales bacterium]|nr:tetratricopeptide repeat protein [Candidatus Acidoferrales bacterium]
MSEKARGKHPSRAAKWRRGVALGAAAAMLALAAAACKNDPEAAARAYMASGRHYLGAKRYKEAAIQFRNALQREPGDWQARYGLAESEAALGDWRASFRDLSTVADRQPSFAPAHLALAGIYVQAEKFALAQRQIDLARQLVPNDAGAEMAEMKLYLASHRLPESAAQCAKLVRMAPGRADVQGACGLAAVAAGDYARAEQAFRRAVELAPAEPENYGNLANALELEGRDGEAEALLRRAAQTQPDALDAQLLLADYYLRHRRLEDADRLFAALLARGKQFPNLAETLAGFWMSRHELARAVADDQLAEAARPSPATEKNLASAYLTLRRIPEAGRYTKMVLRRDPKDPDGRALEGALAYFRGDYAAAAKELEAAAGDDPNSILAKYYLGMTWSATGERERAKGAFSDCIRLNDKFLEAYVQLGALALEANDWRLGAEYARKVLALEPGSLDGYLLLAQADLAEGDLGSAGQVIASGEKLAEPPPEMRRVAMRYDVLRNDFPAADREFGLAAARVPDPFALLGWYAGQLEAAGQTARAASDVRKWMAQAPPSAAAEELLARLLLGQGDLPGAEAAARQALALDSRRATAHQLLGEALERSGRVAGAAAEYAAAIRANPADIRGDLLAGNLLMREGQYERAQSYYESARLESPDSDAAKLALARCWAEQGTHLDQALGIAQELKARYPANPNVADALGWTYHLKGLDSLAVAQLQAAARSLPQDATAQFHWGMTVLSQANRMRASAILDRAVKLGLPGPEQAAAAAALARLERAAKR